MPDVIIKDMEMPECCAECSFCRVAKAFQGDKFYCWNLKAYIGMELGMTRRPDRCPLRPAPEWISVEERLPKDETDCLIAVKGSLSQPICVRTGFYDQTHKCWCQHEEMWAYRPFQFGGSYHVTHWMPLPEPPADEKEADQ